jgi:methionyl-tRNA formyltransferase
MHRIHVKINLHDSIAVFEDKIQLFVETSRPFDLPLRRIFKMTSFRRLFKRHYSILFFGSDAFSIESLKALSKFNLCVVTPPDVQRQSHHRQVPLKKYCLENNIKTFDAPPKTLKGWDPSWLASSSFDLAVVVSFGYFLPRSLLQRFRSAINVHPSLLPKYRGPAPIHHTILNGDTETGISIIELDPKEFDAGRILKQSKFSIENHQSIVFRELHDQLAIQGGFELADTVEHLKEYQSQSVLQDPSRVSHAKKISKEMSIIDWNSHSSLQLDRMHRALGYIFPLTTSYESKRVSFLDIELQEPNCGEINSSPGTLYYDKSGLYVKSLNGWIKVNRLKFFGKKEIQAPDFINGYLPTSLKSRFHS